MIVLVVNKIDQTPYPSGGMHCFSRVLTQLTRIFRSLRPTARQIAGGVESEKEPTFRNLVH
jgi:hypothetical protein